MTDTLEAAPRMAGEGDQTPTGRRSAPDGDGVVRMHLDVEALAGIHVRPGGGPFTETLLSLQLFHTRRPNALGAAWLRQVRPTLQAANLPTALLALMEHLVDLPTVALEAPSIEEAVQQLGTGRIEQLAPTDPALAWSDRAPAPVKSWLRDLRSGDRRALGLLTRVFLDYYRQAVQPYWRSIRSLLETERSLCGNVITAGGLDRLLGSLHPAVRWRPPVLEVEGADRGGSAPDLRGRSLVLVPSAFCLDGARLECDHREPTRPAVLVYPVLRRTEEATALWALHRPPNRPALARLLGRTQAAVLAAIADACTTTELADRIGISQATASHHTGILREAGLIVTRRSGTSVVHRLTPLGADLLCTAE